MPNLVQLYTMHGQMWISTEQLNSPKILLTIFTRSGKKLSDTARTYQARTDAGYGVHRDNLYASKELANAAAERIYADMKRSQFAVVGAQNECR